MAEARATGIGLLADYARDGAQVRGLGLATDYRADARASARGLGVLVDYTDEAQTSRAAVYGFGLLVDYAPPEDPEPTIDACACLAQRPRGVGVNAGGVGWRRGMSRRRCVPPEPTPPAPPAVVLASDLPSRGIVAGDLPTRGIL